MILPDRKLHRLQNYDYSQSGYYFITICTKERRNILATVENAVPSVPSVVPSVPSITTTAIGDIVTDAWNRLSGIDDLIKTDYFCVMPNHIHGIIIIQNQQDMSPETERRGRRSLQDLVRGLKSVTTREYNKAVPQAMKNTLWQSSFYDTIIRSERMLYEIRKYIDENPLRWREDELYKEP